LATSASSSRSRCLVNTVAIHTTIPGPGWLAQASEVSDSAFA
jgi:hypothetical protein